ncbi:MAG TPA: cytochrome c biogenesis protein CcsA, partial [Candidatus Binataceae bacterium]|nr:cytochrome c biogenesis protein CcsA [Candidatus Binataceae bacterium]
MNFLGMLPALVCYLAATGGFTLARTSDPNRWTRRGSIALGGGAILHATVLAGSWMQAGNIQVTDLAESISFLAWLTATAALVLIVRWRLAVIGAFIAPLVFLASTIAALTMHDGSFTMPAALRSAWLPVHVTLAFAGFALFVLAAGVSVVYLAYERRLKSKRLSARADDRTPSLEKLDR